MPRFFTASMPPSTSRPGPSPESSAIVRLEHQPALRRDDLREHVEAVLRGIFRTTVDVEDQRQFPARLVVRWIGENAVLFPVFRGLVRALPADRLASTESEGRIVEGVIEVRELPGLLRLGVGQK